MQESHLLIQCDQTEQLKQRVQEIISKAKKKGASAAEASVGSSEGFDVSVRMGEVEKVEFTRSKGVGIAVYFGLRKGSASTTDLSDEAIESTVEKACHIAQLTGEDPCNGLAEAALMATGYQRPQTFFPWNIDTVRAISMAQECEGIAMAQDARISNSEGASVSTHQGSSAYGNSHGFIGIYTGTRHSISCSVLAKSEGQMERDYSYTVARDPQDLWSIQTVASQAAYRTVNRLNARKLSTRKIPVIYAADVADELIGCFFSAIRGSSLYRRSSFLLDSLGQRVFTPGIHIYERPHLPKGLGSAPFDAEGVATYEKDFINDGILQSYVLSSYSARKLGLKTTANAGGVHNAFIQPTHQGGLAALLKTMGTGLLVTELMGNGVNIVTGDYSQGAFGFWVEKGEIQYPVSEITIAGDLKDMFLHLVAVGDDIDPRNNLQTGSILLEEMTVAGEGGHE